MSGALQLFAIMMAVIAPVSVLVFIIEYFKYKKVTNRRLFDLRKEMADISTADLDKEIAEMKDRIQVLERIITDQSYELERKIGNL